MEFVSQPQPQEHGDQRGNLKDLMIIDNENSDEIVQIQIIHEETNMSTSSETTNKCYLFLLGMNYMLLFIGSISSSLLSKFYFNHKGNSRWVSTWVQSAGFPLLLLPIYSPFYVFKSTHRKPYTNFTPKMLLLCIVIGFFLGLNNLLFSWGNSYLPVSTNSLVLSLQLVFTLITSVIIVKQKITFANLNCVFLLTLSSVLLALGSSHDKPKDLTKTKYFIGFFSTIGAGLLFAIYLPLMEKIYRQVCCYSMVVEMQMVMELSATVLATLGMIINGGFYEMKKEAKNVFDLGEKTYWLTVMVNVLTWQFCFMGTAGMVFLSSSLTGGVCMTALMTVNVLGGVIVFKDNFGLIKVISTLLCIWGFSSYLYGMYKKMEEKKDDSLEKIIIHNEEKNMTTDDA
ncbi:probable purine permease 4 [Solanum pennellii]|uniref:Probable purine permease n=1 Tax=Solanum pennellii TaxID=28526 RepID=A0ABM1FDP8_SOLPN|nr:probable purine permease 4 [Solanum pennellii]